MALEDSYETAEKEVVREVVKGIVVDRKTVCKMVKCHGLQGPLKFKEIHKWPLPWITVCRMVKRQLKKDLMAERDHFFWSYRQRQEEARRDEARRDEARREKMREDLPDTLPLTGDLVDLCYEDSWASLGGA